MDTRPASGNRAMAEHTTTVRRNTQIAFDDGDDYRRTRDNDPRSSFDQSRRRSASRDSIRSARSRSRQPEATLPSGFQTLSFQVSASRGRSDYAEKPGKSGTTKAGDKRPTDFESANDHTITLEALYQRLRTSPQQGLSQDAAARRLTENGLNVLPKRRKNYAKKLLDYVFGGFCSILWVGVIIFFICWRPLGDPDPQAYNLGLAILVIIVIVLQASFSAFQDWSTAKTMNSILDMLPSDALVMRQGEWTTVRTSNIVPGDVVRIRVGDKVTADLRLTTTSGDVHFDHENFLETHNIALMGTLVTNGSATGVVVFTGARTVMGGIAMATTDVKERPTSFQREITRFVRIIVCLTACLACLILFSWAGWLRIKHPKYMNVVAMLNNVMGGVVAFIPEGMPVGVALTLMMIARRMKKADVLPMSLATVEMLGCVQVICSDKTGTLTKNQMSVTTVGFSDRKMTVEESQRDEKDAPAVAMAEMYRAAHLCNEATFDPLSLAKPIEERLTRGNRRSCASIRRIWSCRFIDSRRLSSAGTSNKFAMTLHKDRSAGSGGPGGLLIVKGAPDVLLPHCSHYRSYEGVVRPLDEAAKQRFNELQSSLSRNAERVLMFSQRSYAVGADARQAGFEQKLVDEGMADLVIIGVVGIFDPPRPEAAETVAACRRAGIRFMMMTGDFGLTGAAIARQIGIFTGEREPDTYATITSHRRRSEDDVSEKDFGPRSPPTSTNQNLLLEGTQSASSRNRTGIWCALTLSPENKLRIVTELQKRGMSTAVTGDGVNDASAMNATDVGVAMVNGSDVALEAADLVLLDGFDSIVDGVRLGRLVSQNLQKVISYLLPAGSWSEIWPVLLNVFLGVPLPLYSFLMIIICVFTDLFLSLSLIMEKTEFDLLSLPPRNPKRTI
ncbi:hypothetical protein LTR17_009622 [Elasticomyces elasticus]|nr:hypothetical protein LTR17_009622 [Elasticomyces elasticus]